MTRADREDQLVALRAERERTEAAIPPIEAELGPAERRLEEAQAKYDRTLRLRNRAHAAAAERWQPRTATALEDAKAVLAVADGELQECLVRRNALLTRRGDLRMRCRALETEIDSTEAEIAKVEAVAARTEQTHAGLLRRFTEVPR